MPDTKITALAAITTVAPSNDLFPIVDVSDNSMAASGTTKNITVNQLLGAGGIAALSSATITGDLTVATSSLKVTGGNTGFGTTSPLGKIDVRGTAYFNGTGAAGGASQLIAAFGASGGSNFGQIINTGSTWSLGYGASYSSVGTSAVTWDSSGNLGLGVTPSGWLASNYKALQVNTTGVLASFGSGSNQSTRLANNWFSNTSGTDTYITSNFATVYQQNSGQHQWYTAPSGTAGNAITFTQAMTLDASGNLLVGTTTAEQKLTVFGSASINGGVLGQGALISRDGSSGGANYGSNTGNTSLNAPASGTIRFNVNNGTFAGQFDTSGNLIWSPSATPPTLTTNGQLTVNATSNTNLRFSFRGSDGVTRVANLTLA